MTDHVHLCKIRSKNSDFFIFILVWFDWEIQLRGKEFTSFISRPWKTKQPRLDNAYTISLMHSWFPINFIFFHLCTTIEGLVSLFGLMYQNCDWHTNTNVANKKAWKTRRRYKLPRTCSRYSTPASFSFWESWMRFLWNGMINNRCLCLDKMPSDRLLLNSSHLRKRG